MIQKFDIALDETYDVEIAGGDFVVKSCLDQQIACLLEAVPGDYKQWPGTGIGLSGMILDEDVNAINRTIGLQFKKDGIMLKRLLNRQGKVVIDATY